MDNYYKIGVFVSSKMGVTWYDDTRRILCHLISKNQYLRDMSVDDGAKDYSAQENADRRLEDSHICVFIIGEAYGVPELVMKEHNDAKNNNLARLYYFLKKEDEKALLGSLGIKDEADNQKRLSSLKSELYPNDSAGRLINFQSDLASIAIQAYKDIEEEVMHGYIKHFRNKQERTVSGSDRDLPGGGYANG